MAQGVVAMVKGLQECGLAVALVGDDGKAYTLVPNQAVATGTTTRTPQCCDSSAQVTDGRYATVYKMQHCNMAPTSPPMLYSEFPPQRVECCPGHGHFQVGGTGSGETGFVPAKSSSYRGAMAWADRVRRPHGHFYTSKSTSASQEETTAEKKCRKKLSSSVCYSRPSRDPDAFADSLRKYPMSSSPERSYELMERLVNYSQGRSYHRSPQRNYSPPNRSYDTIHMPPAGVDRCARGSRPGMLKSDRRQRAPEEWPTRDKGASESESCYMKQTFCKNSDARFVRDVTKRLKESIKSMSHYPNHPTASDVCESSDTTELCNTYSVDTETQVVADVISRTVATVPVPAPSSRSVAVSLTPIPSACPLFEQAFAVQADFSSRSIQTFVSTTSRKSVQTTTSSAVLSVNKGELTKKSKSFSEFRIDEELKDEFLHWLEDNSDPKLKKLQESVVKKLRKRYNRLSVSNSERFSVNSEDKGCQDNNRKEIIDQIISELNRMHLRFCKSVESAELIKVTRSDEKFRQPSKVLINEVSMKKHDFSRTQKREQVYDAFIQKIKQWTFKKTEQYKQQSFRADILNLLHKVPIDFRGLSKIVYLNTLAEAFLTKLNNAPVEHKNSRFRCNEDPEQSGPICDVRKNCSQPNIKHLKLLVADSLIEFIYKIKAKLKPECVEEIIIDLIDILLDSISRLNIYDENFAKETAALGKSITMFLENEATEFATRSTGQMKNIIDRNEGIISSPPETVFILQNTLNNRSTDTINNTNNDENNGSRTGKEESCELNIYIRQLSEQIDEWVCSLNIPQTRNEEFRKRVVNDLAGDIVDRYKYLQLNNNSSYKTDELEHLKYQIFKWINKFDGNNGAIDHAPELMERIKGIKKPGMTSTHEQKAKSNSDTSDAQLSQITYTNGVKNVANSDKFDNWKDSDQSIHMPTYKNTQKVFTTNGEHFLAVKSKLEVTKPKSYDNLTDAEVNNIYGTWKDFDYIPKRVNQYVQTVFSNLIDQRFQTNDKQNPSGSMARTSELNDCCKPLISSLKPLSSGPHSPVTSSIKQLNNEFEDYLNNWVKEIPIHTNNPEELAVAEKARIGICHGIWKAIARAKFEPAIFHNRFYYEDVLEEAIDELLDILPQTKELQDKRHMLKAKLIEKTMDITELIKTVATPASYKEQLNQQVTSNLPRRTVKTEEENPKQLYEDMLIQCIAEDFILASSYKDEDKLKVSAYRNKVKKKVEALIDGAKKIHGKDAQDLNKELCIEDIITALRKVPMPSEATLKEEADEIILGHEIDQWFADLPVVNNDDPQEQLLRRRLKDALTIKLHEMEKNINFAEIYDEPEFKHEISLFLDKVPLEKDEDLNINFMVDELANRMKNRERPGHKRKFVAFQAGLSDCCRKLQVQDNGPGPDYNQSQDIDQGQDNGRGLYNVPGQNYDQGQKFGRGLDNSQGKDNARDQYNGRHQDNGCGQFGSSRQDYNQGHDIGQGQDNDRGQYNGPGQNYDRGQKFGRGQDDSEGKDNARDQYNGRRQDNGCGQCVGPSQDNNRGQYKSSGQNYGRDQYSSRDEGNGRSQYEDPGQDYGQQQNIGHGHDNGYRQYVGPGQRNGRDQNNSTGQDNGRGQYNGPGQDYDRGQNFGRGQDESRGKDNARDQYNGRRQDNGCGQCGGSGQDSGRNQYYGQQLNDRSSDNRRNKDVPESRFIRQPFDEAEYDEFFKKKPANSTMINPPPDNGQNNNKPVPDFRQWGLDSQPSQKWYSFDSAGNVKESREQPEEKLAYVPGKFQEKRLGGKFGDVTQSPDMPNMHQSSPQYARNDAMDSANVTRQGPPMRTFFDNSGNYIPSPCCDQKQPIPAPQNIDRVPLFNNESAMQKPEDVNLGVGSVNGGQAYDVPTTCPGMKQSPPAPTGDQPIDNSSYRQFTTDKPPSSSWHELPEDEYHSLLHVGPVPPPKSQCPHPSHYEVDKQAPEEVQGGRFALDATQSSQGQYQRTAHPFTNNPVPGDSGATPNYPEGFFVKSQTGMNQDQSHPKGDNVPKPPLPPCSPGSPRLINSGYNKLEGIASEPTFHRSTSGAGTKQTIEWNRKCQTSQQTIERPSTDFNIKQKCDSVVSPIRTFGIKTTEPIESAQSCQRLDANEQDQRLQTQMPSQTGFSIDNQPVGFSTPNQRPNNEYPPNVKERRQLVVDGQSRRGEIDVDEQVRERCMCLERPKRCVRRSSGFFCLKKKDRRSVERDKLSGRHCGTEDYVEVKERCQCADWTRRTRRDMWCDFENYMAGGIPLFLPYPYFSHPCFNLGKINSRHFPRHPACNKPSSKFR